MLMVISVVFFYDFFYGDITRSFIDLVTSTTGLDSIGRRCNDVVTPGRGTGGQHKTIAGFGFMVNGAGIKTLVDRC